jgi:superfamily II DNA or RNA helicase
MSLARALSWRVPANVRDRGAEIHRNGLVRLAACTSQRVAAEVTGTEGYAVTLEREGRRLWAKCTCPYFRDQGEPCKHIWATILAADGEGGLRGPRGGVPKELVVRGVDDWLNDPFEDGEDDFEDLDDWLEKEAPTKAKASAAAPPRPPSPAPNAPAWREVLAPLVAPSYHPVRREEIVYVIDLPVTLQRKELTLDVLTFRRKKDGTPGAHRQLRITRSQVQSLSDPADREALTLLTGAMRGDPWSSWYYFQHQQVPLQPWIPDEIAVRVARLLCATGRFHVRSDPQKLEEPALRWDDGPPWEVWFAVREVPGRRDEADGYLEVVPELRRGDARLNPQGLAFLARAGLLISRDVLARLDPGGAWKLVSLLPLEQPLRVPAAEGDDLLAVLLEAPSPPRLDLPAALRPEETNEAPRPRLRLLPPEPYAYTYRDWPLGKVSFLYASREVTAAAASRGTYLRGERRFLVRDREAEERALARLGELGFRPAAADSAGEPVQRISPSRAPAAVRSLLSEGWSVEAQGKLYRSAGAFSISVASGIDWFELHGDVDFEGTTVQLPALLEALRRGDGFVALGDGSVGLLPEEWMQRWAPLARLGETEGDHLRFTPSQAVLLDAWLADEPEVTCDETFSRARERLRGFAGIAPAAAPPGFRGTLRPYQEAGLAWLGFLRDFGLGGCLADDMGLGKTVQVLAFLEARRALRRAQKLPPSLVVVPRSLVFNWLAEAAQFTPKLRILDHTGAGRDQEGESFAGCDVVLTTYGTLRRDIAVLKETPFDVVILDEAQAIKNAGSLTAKAARLLRGGHRLALTGTPIENHLGELWSLLEFLNPGFLGASALKSRASELRNPGASTREVLARALRPVILRRTKAQVATDLPERVEQTLICELPPKQRRLYDELRVYYRAMVDKRIGAQGLGRAKFLALEALLRLRQAACHPALLDRGHADDPCAKLDLLLPTLREVLAEGHKVLVFSQFTSFLALLRRQLETAGLPYLYLDGQTRDRQARVEEFQSAGGAGLFLISLKAGGLGLNLTAADYVYLLDPWWNPAVEAQAVDRAHRIGQARTVFAYRLVARDTVEEKILELQAGKRALADAIIQADESLLASLSREDLALLLS